jgi:hypothetical protein
MPAVLSSQPGAEITTRSLWFGATAAAIAWALDGAVCEVIASEACRTNAESWGPFSATGTKVLLGGITAVAVAVSVAAILVSFRNWRRLTESSDFIHAPGDKRKPFMGMVGVFAGIALTAGLIWQVLPLLFLDVCVKAR